MDYQLATGDGTRKKACRVVMKFHEIFSKTLDGMDMKPRSGVHTGNSKRTIRSISSPTIHRCDTILLLTAAEVLPYTWAAAKFSVLY